MPKYEVQTHRDKRWLTRDLYDFETQAIVAAKKIYATSQADGVRVVLDRLTPEGLHREKIIFEEMRSQPKDKPVRITPIEDGARCASVAEVYALESRMTIGRLLKSYLEQQILLPSELLHCSRPLTRFQEADGQLMPSAVDRIVGMQCRIDPSLNAKVRRDEIYDWIAEIGRRARRSEGEKLLWPLSLDDFHKVVATVAKCAFVHEEQVALLCHVIARETGKERSFLGKLEVLLGCVSEDLTLEVLRILDGFIADALAVSQVVQEILGVRPNLANALIALLDFIDGKAGTAATREPETAKVLRRLFAEGKLPDGLTVLLDRVTRELGGRQPLTRNDPDREEAAFLALLDRLVKPEGVAGGTAVAAALTRRYGLRLEQGGLIGWKLSVLGVSRLLGENARRMQYLCEVAGAAEGANALTVVAEEVVEVVKPAADIHHFVAPDLATPEKLRILTGLQRALGTSSLPEVLRTRVVGRLDDLLARYLVDAAVVEKLDAPGDSLRLRAVRLVKFCGSGLLLEGKALAIARSRVLHHLRQPNFVEDFTQDFSDPGEREARLRDFYRMLAEAGFRI
ncbi:hypothetical protein [Rhodospirillum rubrum]|uniref:Uncharacterized protein n=1 Tax=Rhodospirillum rubrum (strain ATCC 11170 / ATH 1.1.1 / DSM 467 / LMG 4362 / NCIMB 8255 / S1) TaxID=269796 RepID=Q2RS96_RHORT|nr:hypothetical protein [Rhodospirillum rubrum]ABC22999.1 hypothetical protein Rru_A2199 [Rhodospirillum rubrum ATCC 11170]AEO48728.1 hypothetical protein F11_11320 [Rhodospirillum rubrum F11]MBK5954622.1 hypothetical protein [Rhodospirillum rubrum]QXG78983.1 hypothetical protein KUL73_11365 [Rhodospirillum rubrum]HAP98775.1 hypothetical protein [Rhodospirillum rubrum]